MGCDAIRGVADGELVVWALLGNLRAFDELARRYRQALVRVAQQVVGSREVAEDVAQEALLLGFKALPQLREPARVGAWFCAIARRRARRVLRSERHGEPTEPSRLDRLILEQSPEAARHPQAEVFRSLEAVVLQATLAEVPSQYRVVLELRYLDEWPVARIAELLSLPVSTVKWRLHHGLALVRRRLAEADGGRPRGAAPRGNNLTGGCKRGQSGEQTGTGPPAAAPA